MKIDVRNVKINLMTDYSRQFYDDVYGQDFDTGENPHGREQVFASIFIARVVITVM